LSEEHEHKHVPVEEIDRIMQRWKADYGGDPCTPMTAAADIVIRTIEGAEEPLEEHDIIEVLQGLCADVLSQLFPYGVNVNRVKCDKWMIAVMAFHTVETAKSFSIGLEALIQAHTPHPNSGAPREDIH
jgi:hypothetical protein